MVDRAYGIILGQKNYAWRDCLDRSAVAVMNRLENQPYWERNDPAGYLASKIRHGENENPAVSSKHFNLMTTVNDSAYDLWVHKENGEIWWTVSRDEPSAFVPMRMPVPDYLDVITCFKPCLPWRNTDIQGKVLKWHEMSAKFKGALHVVSTMKGIYGEGLATVLETLGIDLPFASYVTGETKIISPADPWGAAVRRMVETARATVANADGRTIERIAKTKELRLAPGDLSTLLRDLIDRQGGKCALTGLRMLKEHESGDDQLRCSLDRIDSDGHYERGNLQVVCKFINRWKCDDDDGEFRRLIGVLRNA